MDTEVLKKIGTLGGKIQLNSKTKDYYFGGCESGGPLSKERLFGMRGSLYPGTRQKRHEVALEATQSDTRKTLIRELTDQSHMTRREAEEVVDSLIRSGVLEEINDPTLGKVLVIRRR